MTLDLTVGDYVVIAPFALSALAAGFGVVAKYFENRKQNALSNVFGAAGRVAAEIAVILKAIPINGDAHSVTKKQLVDDSVPEIVHYWGSRMKIAQIDETRLTSIVSREVDKQLLPNIDPALASAITPKAKIDAAVNPAVKPQPPHQPIAPVVMPSTAAKLQDAASSADVMAKLNAVLENQDELHAKVVNLEGLLKSPMAVPSHVYVVPEPAP